MEKIKNNNLKIYMLTLICFIVGTTQFSIVGMLDKIANSVGVSVSTAGQLVTVYAFSYAIGTPLVIIAISKLDHRKQLLIGLATILVGIFTMVVFQGFVFLLVARIILGIGTGVFMVNANSIANKLAIPGKEGSAMSNISMGMGASLVFGVPLGRMVATNYSWKTIFIIIGVLTILSLVVIQKTIPTIKGQDSIPLSERIGLLKNPQILIMLSVSILVFISFSTIDTYITPYLNTAIPKIQNNLSFILLILGIGSLIGSKLGGLLADRIGIKKTIFGALIVQFLVLVVVSFGHKLAIVNIIGLMIWQIACWIFGSTQSLNLVTMMPEAVAIILSLNTSFVQLGIALGAGVGGVVVGQWSVLSVIWIGALGVAVAMVLFKSKSGSKAQLQS